MLSVLHLRLQLMSNNLLHVTTCYQQVVCERRDNGTGKMVLSLLSAGLNVGCFYAVSTLLNRMITEQYPVSSSSHYAFPISIFIQVRAMMDSDRLIKQLVS